MNTRPHQTDASWHKDTTPLRNMLLGEDTSNTFRQAESVQRLQVTLPESETQNAYRQPKRRTHARMFHPINASERAWVYAQVLFPRPATEVPEVSNSVLIPLRDV
jgi:hypothetical protein